MDSKCVGCETPIPYGADSCPMCGAKIKKDVPVITIERIPPKSMPATAPAEVHHHHHVSQCQPLLIEKTAKKWKKLQLIAGLFMVLGMVSCMAGVSNPSSASGTMPFMTIFWIIGLALYVRARFGAWWHHG